MGGYARLWAEGDAITRAVALLLLAMSVSAWVVILWKAWVLGRVRRDMVRAVSAFWACPDLPAARSQLQALDREQVLTPLLEAARRLTIDAADCVYVGDDLRDVQAGRAAGMATIAAAWGYLGEGEAIEAWGADHVVQSPAELLKLLALA